MSDILILRPQPGARQSGARAAALGLRATITPIFTIRPLEWQPPSANAVDAVMLTSANAARHAGESLCPFLSLACYAVGEATAREARKAGFSDVRIGASDGEALFALAARDKAGRILHLCGREHVDPAPRSLEVIRHEVYGAEPVPALSDAAREALDRGAVALIHSPRAAILFARLAEQSGLARGAIRLAAISAAAADAAGLGWKSMSVALAPRDEALLELAASLCKNGAR